MRMSGVSKCYLHFRPIVYLFVWTFLKSRVNGAQTTLYAALDPDLNSVSGKYFSDCAIKKVDRRAEDDQVAEWLWSTSEQMTKLNMGDGRLSPV